MFVSSPELFHFWKCVKQYRDMQLIPLEKIHSSRDSVRKAGELHLIDKAMTLEPHGLNRRDELLPPQGFRPEAKSRGGTLVTRAYIKDSTYSSNIQSVY